MFLMSKNNVPALIGHGQTDRKLFGRGWYNQTTDDYKHQQATDNNNGCITILQNSALVLRLITKKTKCFTQNILLKTKVKN